MTAEIIPIAGGGEGAYAWNGSSAITNRYTIRRGHRRVASIVVEPDLPFHSAVLNEFCAVLDRIERDEGPCPHDRDGDGVCGWTLCPHCRRIERDEA